MAPPTAGRTRPLTGEPIALDLLNTRWVLGSVSHDLLESLEGLEQWLDDVNLAERFSADLPTLTNLLHTREVLGRLVTAPGDPAMVEALNSVLAHGRVRRSLQGEKPAETAEFDHPSWGAAWTAADNYLALLRRAPDRIRPCADSQCVLHFFDTSKNGSRRWCSMAGCGNRAKAARHQARNRSAQKV